MERKYSKRELFTQDIEHLLAYLHCLGYGVTQGEAFRTNEQQAWHRQRGLSKVLISQHQKRLGKDLLIWQRLNPRKYITKEQWIEVGNFWKRLDPQNRWGGDFGLKKFEIGKKLGWDRTHFERRG